MHAYIHTYIHTDTYVYHLKQLPVGSSLDHPSHQVNTTRCKEKFWVFQGAPCCADGPMMEFSTCQCVNPIIQLQFWKVYTFLYHHFVFKFGDGLLFVFFLTTLLLFGSQRRSENYVLKVTNSIHLRMFGNQN